MWKMLKLQAKRCCHHADESHRPLSRSRVRQNTHLVVMCTTSQCKLRCPFRNVRVTKVICIVTYYTLPPIESLDSFWMTRSQRSKRRDKGLFNSSLCTFIGMKHIFVYHTIVFEADTIYKTLPQMSFHVYVLPFYFALGLHP